MTRSLRLLLLALPISLLVAPPAGAEPRVPLDPSAAAHAAAHERASALVSRRLPQVQGVPRFGRTLRATPGRWSPRPTSVRYQWMRAGRPVAGARSASYTVRPGDVGRGLRVQVTARAPGHRATSRLSEARGATRHRTDVRRLVTYSVTTRGRVGTDMAQVRRQVQQTFEDPRGWRGGGVAFRRVRSGGSFTLVLAEASTLPSYSSVCSTMWSCRVGRFVVINQDRWRGASPAWNAAGRSRRDYRHMVVNHETGHWLGLGHASCPGPGRVAPVMMQQSKGTQGCRLNPWPTRDEQRRG